MTERTIFLTALEITDPAERATAPLRAGQQREAEGLARQIVQHQPTSANQGLLLGVVLRERRGLEALGGLHWAVTLSLGNAEARSTLGVALGEARRVGDVLDPRNPPFLPVRRP